jgi:hypothetical protein
MATNTQGRARKEVERTRKKSEAEERQRIAGSATDVAAARVAKLKARRGFRRFLFENGLSIAAFTLFVLSFIGQVAAGHRAHNEEQRNHGESTIGLSDYLQSGAFIEATAENWESEFLQIGLFVVLTAFLYQKGSSESKRIDEPEAVDQDPSEARGDPNAPWPVQRGGIALTMYKQSLSVVLFALFAISFAAHAVGGAMDYNDEQRLHGGATISALAYLGTSRFWFESFQNWQSEFFSVGVLVVLTIWLRQQGSPQSKPVAASADDTGE